MGQFSWLDCETGEQIVDDRCVCVYLLIPQVFGGGHILETCYDGYGRFGGEDVYDLIAKWNRNFIPEMIRLASRGNWHCDMFVMESTLMDFYDGKPVDPDTRRDIGIMMACYDEDNERLPYPIKITHDSDAVYEDCCPSPSDPDQGWVMDDDNDDWY